MTRPNQPAYEVLVGETQQAVRGGWDFSFMADRMVHAELPWDYVALATEAASTADTVVDIATGGGELLAQILRRVRAERRPTHVIALEPYAPNVPVARRTLSPLSAEVREMGARLPVEDGWAELVLDRHGAFDANEIARILAPDGRFVLQGVGTGNDAELNVALGAPPPDYGMDVAVAAEALASAGLVVDQAESVGAPSGYRDIAAVVFQLSMVSWQIPDFGLERYDERLRILDRRLRTDGPLMVTNQRLLLRAHRPA